MATSLQVHQKLAALPRVEDDAVNVKFLGEGGFAKTWLVRDRDGREYVRKICKNNVKGALGEKILAEFSVREIENLEKIAVGGSDYVVRYYGSEWCCSTLCLKLEYLRGGTLRDHLSKGTVSAHAAMRCYYQLVEAVKYLHLNEIYHRDLKPENAVFTEPDPGTATLKLIDLGLARRIEDAVASTQCGTDTYMYPLMGQGTYDRWVPDVYSLAAIVFYDIFNVDYVKKIDKMPRLKSAVVEASLCIADVSCLQTLDDVIQGELYKMCERKYFSRGGEQQDDVVEEVCVEVEENVAVKMFTDGSWGYAECNSYGVSYVRVGDGVQCTMGFLGVGSVVFLGDESMLFSTVDGVWHLEKNSPATLIHPISDVRSLHACQTTVAVVRETSRKVFLYDYVASPEPQLNFTNSIANPTAFALGGNGAFTFVRNGQLHFNDLQNDVAGNIEKLLISENSNFIAMVSGGGRHVEVLKAQNKNLEKVHHEKIPKNNKILSLSLSNTTATICTQDALIAIDLVSQKTETLTTQKTPVFAAHKALHLTKERAHLLVDANKYLGSTLRRPVVGLIAEALSADPTKQSSVRYQEGVITGGVPCVGVVTTTEYLFLPHDAMRPAVCIPFDAAAVTTDGPHLVLRYHGGRTLRFAPEGHGVPLCSSFTSPNRKTITTDHLVGAAVSAAVADPTQGHLVCLQGMLSVLPLNG